MSLKLKIIACGLFTVIVAAGLTWASCGSATCPIDTTTAEQSEKGYIRLDYSYEYINQDQPKIGRRNASAGEIDRDEDEVFTLNEIQRIGLDAGLTDRLGIQVVLPFIRREHQHLEDDNGTDVTESWNFSGMGDLTLLSRYAVKLGIAEDSRISVIAGGVLPTGRDHVVNADGSEAEASILPGTGAYSLILGASLSKKVTAKTLNGLYAKLPVFFSSTYQWNGKGVEDYKMGNTWLANVGIVYPVLPKVGLMLQSNLRVARQDDQGETSAEVDKTGGTYVYISPGIQFLMGENLWSYMHVQLPIYQRVNEIQLTSDSNFIAGLSYRFSTLK
jgi:hypothetical protein